MFALSRARGLNCEFDACKLAWVAAAVGADFVGDAVAGAVVDVLGDTVGAGFVIAVIAVVVVVVARLAGV